MQGIRINNKCSIDPKKITMDYEFRSIIEPITNDISNLYWVLNSRVTFNYIASDGTEFKDYQNQYDNLILDEKDGFRLTQTDFIPRYAKFIVGDWDDIYGIKQIADFQEIQEIDEKNIMEKTHIMFRCIDAAFWEIYARDRMIIDKISKCFPHSTLLSYCSVKYD